MDSPDKLRKTQAVLAAVFEATPDYVGIANVMDGHFLFLNPAARRLVGRGEKEDLSTMRLSDLHPPPALWILTNEGIPHSLREGSWEGENTVLNKEGREIPVSQVIVSHQNLDGDARFISLVMRDLTERKKLEEQLRQAQKMEAIGRLAGGVAHDFNNLLTVIGGYSEMALLKLSAEDPIRKYIQAIGDAGVRAASLTRQMLTFSRQTVLEPKVVNLNDVVREAESLLRRLIGEDVLLTTVLDPALSRVKIDPASFGQVLMNLAINACDAMPRGGHLTIETCDVSRKQGAVASPPQFQPGAYVMLTTTDTGSGMSHELRGRIFEPFFTTKVGKGTGPGSGCSPRYCQTEPRPYRGL
jgi:two-component system cell cycle sensor histidine kinase/response regulator CckA